METDTINENIKTTKLNDEIYCPSCAKIIKAEAEICPHCGVRNKANPNDKPSKSWYWVSIFLGLLGGIIGYFSVKKRDKELAQNLLVVGIIVQIIGWVIMAM